CPASSAGSAYAHRRGVDTRPVCPHRVAARIVRHVVAADGALRNSLNLDPTSLVVANVVPIDRVVDAVGRGVAAQAHSGAVVVVNRVVSKGIATSPGIEGPPVGIAFPGAIVVLDQSPGGPLLVTAPLRADAAELVVVYPGVARHIRHRSRVLQELLRCRPDVDPLAVLVTARRLRAARPRREEEVHRPAGADGI